MQSQQHIGVRLPTIDLPKFSGAYDTWLEFRDTYKSLIHTNDVIGSDMQRFHYLRALLIGDAAQVIKSLAFCEDNYQSAWTLICNRYDNSSLLVHNHVRALFELEPILRESSDKVRALIDSISKHLSALKSLGEPVQSWDTLIIYMGTTKLDIATAREWEGQRTKDNATLDKFLEYLNKRADFLETIETKLGSKREQSTCKSVASNPRTSRTYGKPNVRSMKAIINTCSFCKGEHFVLYCKVLTAMPVEERISAVYKANLCVNCIRPGHHTRDCNSRFKCKDCHGRHHSLLHLDRSRVTDNPTSTVVAAAPAAISQTCTVPQ